MGAAEGRGQLVVEALVDEVPISPSGDRLDGGGGDEREPAFDAEEEHAISGVLSGVVAWQRGAWGRAGEGEGPKRRAGEGVGPKRRASAASSTPPPLDKGAPVL